MFRIVFAILVLVLSGQVRRHNEVEGRRQDMGALVIRQDVRPVNRVCGSIAANRDSFRVFQLGSRLRAQVV